MLPAMLGGFLFGRDSVSSRWFRAGRSFRIAGSGAAQGTDRERLIQASHDHEAQEPFLGQAAIVELDQRIIGTGRFGHLMLMNGVEQLEQAIMIAACFVEPIVERLLAKGLIAPRRRSQGACGHVPEAAPGSPSI